MQLYTIHADTERRETRVNDIEFTDLVNNGQCALYVPCSLRDQRLP
jgi:hypothetical protein